MQCKNFAAPAICEDSTAEVMLGLPQPIVVVGEVDHGKSTLLGRWLVDGGCVASDRYERVKQICQDKDIEFEPAFLLDAFEEEQTQGISIDSARFHFAYGGRRFIFIDAPGHRQFINNMTGAAAAAQWGILVIDIAEGIRPQTIKHLKILAVLGMHHIIVAINKLDKVGWSADAFEALRRESEALLARIPMNCSYVLPISALYGDNLLALSSKMPWYKGPTLMQALCHQTAPAELNRPSEPFRMLLQDVYKFSDDRHFVGRVISGSIAPGTSIYFSPSAKVSKIQAIDKYPNGDIPLAVAGDCIALRLTEQVFLERGEVISLPDQAPEVDSRLMATMVWLEQEPLQLESTYLLKIGTAEVTCSLSIENESPEWEDATRCGDIRDVIITTTRPVAFERSAGSHGLNQFVLCSSDDTVAAGRITGCPLPPSHVPRQDMRLLREQGYLAREERELGQKHKATVIWLTGLSGAGKSTIAKALERKLYDDGRNVFVLDADNLRAGLCADLGFSREHRGENIRRIAEIANLLLNAGFIVVAACLSPYARDRDLARNIIGSADFIEIFVSCPLAVCQKRDPKGLYRKATEGEITSFSGIDSPYQPPTSPSLTIDSTELTVEQEVDTILTLLAARGIFDK